MRHVLRVVLLSLLPTLAALFLAGPAVAEPSDRPCDRASARAIERSTALAARCASPDNDGRVTVPGPVYGPGPGGGTFAIQCGSGDYIGAVTVKLTDPVTGVEFATAPTGVKVSTSPTVGSEQSSVDVSVSTNTTTTVPVRPVASTTCSATPPADA